VDSLDVVIELTDTKRRIVERLKRVESATATDLAAEFGLTDTALRQHLDVLESAGLVSRSAAEPVGRGRPPVNWRLADAAATAFPDRHADLSVDLIESIRAALGERALQRVIDARSVRQSESYALALSSIGELGGKVQSLAALRSDEGYLAEASSDGDAYVLTEHHCPIRAAANACGTLCDAELASFKHALGDVDVSRQQHVLTGDNRCSYRITPARLTSAQIAR
jgi:predicted ArsR family transcriptional regulator